MRRLLQIGRERNLFKASLSAAIFGLLFALTALVVAKTPPRHPSASGATKTARTSTAGFTVAGDTQVTAVNPFVGTNAEHGKSLESTQSPAERPFSEGSLRFRAPPC